MRALLLLALALLAGCPSSAVPGLALKAQAAKYGLNTRANCSAPEELVRAADLALVLVAREADRMGLIAYSELARKLDGRVMGCLLEQPEPCSYAG